MHLHFEQNTNAKCDCNILSLSWMGKVPDELPEEEGWKLNRTNYYQEGWLATGNVRGVVGVTFTTSHCRKNAEVPQRTNYNLRGHRSDVILVKWNEPYQKLASCDSSGVIFVWIKYEGRWSIELINDRNTPVTHFSWSHDGRMALICYQDGFVLVGSVAGQRYWSSMLNLDTTISCGIWTPDDQQVYFGTTGGEIIIMDVHGAMVSQVELHTEPITNMAWSCEKFKMEEGEDAEPGVSNAADRTFVLAVSFQNGHIYLLKNYDDVSPIHIKTDFDGKHIAMEWSNSRELLAVAGTLMDTEGRLLEPPSYTNIVKFYSDTGILLYTTVIPGNQMPVSSMTWGHNDRRVFVATGSSVQVARAWRRVGSLQLLARLSVRAALKKPTHLSLLPLPPRLAGLVASLFTQTISCCVPEPTAVRDFVSRASRVGRLHCTMLRGGGEGTVGAQGAPSVTYTLYLEHMGGLVPLLKGRRFSKIRPEFVIFDPQSDGSETDSSHWFRIKSNGDVISNTSSSGNSSAHSHSSNSSHNHHPSYLLSDSSDTDKDEGCSGSPRLQRRKKGRHRNAKTQQPPIEKEDDIKTSDELGYIDSLPEDVPLVEVTSNIWGTKFKMHGLAKNIPANLGQVTYKTSLLHLQPRQMTLVMTELRDNFPMGPDPNFNPNIFSEDEEDVFQQLTPKTKRSFLNELNIPSSPRANHATRARSSTLNHEFVPVSSNHEQNNNSGGMSNDVNNIGVPALAKAESYEDEFPYGEDTNSNNDNIRTNNNANVKNHSREQNNIIPSYSRTATSNEQTYSNNAARNHSNPITNGSYNPSGGLGRSGSSGSQRSGGSHSGRHAISPLCCEGSVPTLQSPKNAVAPSDIIFDRPPAQTMMSYHSSGADYSQNVQQVKSNLENHSQSQFHLSLDHNRQVLIKKMESHMEAVANRIMNTNRGETTVTQATVQTPRASLHNIHESHSAMFKYCTRKENKPSPNDAKKDDLKYIDEEGNGSLSPDSLDNGCPKVIGNVLPITPIGIPIASAPISDTMIRSCSVGYLDIVNSQLVPCEITLAMLRKEAPKRLILVNKKSNRNNFNNSNTNNRHTNKKHNNQIQQLNLKLDPKTITKTNKSEQQKQQQQQQQMPKTKMPNLKTCGKSKSLDSSEMFMMAKNDLATLPTNEEEPSSSKSPTLPGKENGEIEKEKTTPKSNNEKPENGMNSNTKTKRQSGSKLGFFNSRTPILGRKKKRDHPSCDVCKCITPGVDPPSPSHTPDPYICIACQESSNCNTPTKKKGFFRERYSPGSDKSRSSSPKIPTEGNNSEIETERAPSPSPNEQKSNGSMSGPAWTLALEQLLHLLREKNSGTSGGTTTPPVVTNSATSSPRLPRSSPASPAPSKKNKRTASASPIRKHLLNSPLLNRRRNKSKTQESSDDETGAGSGDDVVNGKNYRDLETFQKAQLRQKLKRGKIEPVGGAGTTSSQTHSLVRKEFVMHNKAPMWNESSQVYQLDFGGRVTQESAKNFQIEFRGKQVMQFGRIDGNAYTLDFQYPFSALQAFAVALANVTQRLK